MKYIRTKDEIYLNILDGVLSPQTWIDRVIEEADTIEDLCDEFVLVAPYRFKRPKTATELEKELYEMINFYTDKDDKIYGAIWTDGGLIYKARMKGVLPNGEIDWELL